MRMSEINLPIVVIKEGMKVGEVGKFTEIDTYLNPPSVNRLILGNQSGKDNVFSQMNISLAHKNCSSV